MRSQSGDDLTGRFPDHGFLLVFNVRFLSSMYHLRVTGIFSINDYGGTPISVVTGSLRPEVTSSVDIAITVFYSCYINIYRLSSTVSVL